MFSRRAASTSTRLLTQEALEDCVGRTVGDEVPLFSTEEAAGRSSVRLSVWWTIVGRFLRIFLVEVASGSGSGWRQGHPPEQQLGWPRLCGQQFDSEHP